MRITPDLPRSHLVRGRIANALFATLFVFSWGAFLVGELIGTTYFGTKGFFIGLPAGWILGMWIRRSLGVCNRNLTRGFFIRMLDRGNGSPARLLESWVEALRGRRLTMVDCRALVGIRGEATRRWQAYDSPEERERIRWEQDQRILRVLYGGVDTSETVSQAAVESLEGTAKAENPR